MFIRGIPSKVLTDKDNPGIVLGPYREGPLQYADGKGAPPLQSFSTEDLWEINIFLRILRP